MIQAEHLSKRYGEKRAVDDVGFTIRPGQVTGFLGPNGAGKSTTMRMIVGLDRPTSGTVTIGGKRYDQLKSPLREVGALLDAKAVHTGRTARDHLRAMAATHGIASSRVDEVIGLTGLDAVAGKRVGGFSLGMGQRLGIAAAVLGDPHTLILDEPVNGLDPEGVLWVRTFVRHLAAEGRTVFLSSHLMSEMALTADHVIVLGKGRVLADGPLDDLVRQWTATSVLVRTPHATQLAALFTRENVSITRLEEHLLEITGVSSAEVGVAAAGAALVLHELTPKSGSLEDAYLSLTGDSVEYRTGGVR
ncbi:ABC transporter ATP-binding protein [Plantibacter sp. Mn2098]|uniref:ABC transporter ATP-binding protein n=1 Tax=Plantibacter sp. Mn2098 TaxID=3395266 RepID=UPI003BC26E0F